MRHFGIAPSEWKLLSRYDRRTLHYQLVMENHFQAAAMEKAKKEAERKRAMEESKSRAMKAMPMLARRRR